MPIEFCKNIIECLKINAEKETMASEKITLYKEALKKDQRLFQFLEETDELKIYARCSYSDEFLKQLAVLNYDEGEYWAALE